jgi:hypothetical protein
MLFAESSRNTAHFVGDLIVPRSWHEPMIAVLGSYIDGSNLHDGAPIVVVAGVAANTKLWPIWEDKWKALLDFADVPRWHHTDFMRKRRTRRDGTEDVWPEADWLLARAMLCEAFEAVTPVYFGQSVWKHDYEELGPRFPKLPDDPYYFLLDRCMHRLIQGLFEHPVDEGVAIYCDQDKDRALVLGLGQWHTSYIRGNPNVGHPGDSERQVTTSTRNHHSAQAIMRISVSCDSRILRPRESRFYESGY